MVFTVIYGSAAGAEDIAPRGRIDIAEIERRIEILMQHPQMVGLSVAIVEGGDITYVKGFGETLKGSGDKVTSDTVFRWASVSKGVAAAALLDLSHHGKLSLDMPIGQLAPSLQLPDSRGLTIEHLLSHRLGITRNAYDIRIEEGRRPKHIRAALKTLPLLCAPGTCHTYQNVAFDAASEIVETVTRMPYKAVVAEHIFGPLGMRGATTTLAGLKRSRSWAKPHNRAGRPISRVKPTYYRVPAAAGVNSSIKDMARWMRAQMTSGPYSLPQYLRAEMQTPRVDTPREDRRLRRHYKALTQAQYGLGWRIYNYNGRKVVGHRGAVEGYRASILFDPAAQAGMALLWNSPQGRPVGLQLEFMDQLYGLPRRDWARIGAR